MKRISLPNYVRRTGAQYETTERFVLSSDVVDSTAEEVQAAGVPMARIDDNQYATSKGEYHCFVIGDSGCGKSRRVILPTIRLLAKTGESMVISDPKGELYRTTSESLRKKGYDVLVLNFRNPARGNRWNPLEMVERLYHAGTRESRDKAMMMLGDIADVLKAGLEGGGKQDPYWAMSAANVFRGVALLILEYGQRGQLTFENIALTGRDIGQQVSDDSGRNRRVSDKANFLQFIDKLPANSPIVHNLSVIITNSNTTRNCIMSEFEAMIALYSSQELLMDTFSCSEIDVSSLGVRPTALFFILPDDSAALYPIATVFVKQVYSALVDLADEQPNGRLPNRVTFLLDEFANFAKIPSIDSMLTAARSRRIRFVLVCQSMDQLTTKYEEHGRETLLANCRVWIYMSCRNLPFLKRLQELIGNYHSPYTGEDCPLIDISDLQHFEMGQVLVLNDRCSPMLSQLPDYSEYQFGEEECPVARLPEPRADAERSHFNLLESIKDGPKTTTKTVRNPESAPRASEGLRAAIEGMMAERQTQTQTQPQTQSQTTPPAPPPKKTAQKQEGTTSVYDTGHFLYMMEQFQRGAYTKAAQYTIDQLGEPGMDKVNLAFLIRYGKIDVSKLSCSFSLEIPELLKEDLEKGEPHAKINMALYKAQENDLDGAAQLLRGLNNGEWHQILGFWRKELWEEKKDPEGALICLLASRNNAITFPDEVVEDLTKKAQSQFEALMKKLGLAVLEMEESEDASEDADPLAQLLQQIDEKLAELEGAGETQPGESPEVINLDDDGWEDIVEQMFEGDDDDDDADGGTDE